MAYGNIYSNKGAMTPGASEETADGMSGDKIDQITGLMRHERYRFAPARRVYIPKKNGKLRPLGLPSWSDKLVGEVVRLLLEAYYEPRFSGRSHGFRKRRGCHTALREINNTWTGTTWFIEGDISDCFGSFDHEILLGILAEKIHDQRFLRLIRNMLKAGYLEDWEYHDTLSGCPQGGVVSPILSNIYLHKLDEFVEQELIPQYTRGARRKGNPEYERIKARLRQARKHGDRAEARELEKQMRSLPSSDPMDPGYRRLRYLRYADLSGRPDKSASGSPFNRSFLTSTTDVRAGHNRKSPVCLADPGTPLTCVTPLKWRPRRELMSLSASPGAPSSAGCADVLLIDCVSVERDCGGAGEGPAVHGHSGRDRDRGEGHDGSRERGVGAERGGAADLPEDVGCLRAVDELHVAGGCGDERGCGLEDEDGGRVALGIEGQGSGDPERARGRVIHPGRHRGPAQFHWDGGRDRAQDEPLRVRHPSAASSTIRGRFDRPGGSRRSLQPLTVDNLSRNCPGCTLRLACQFTVLWMPLWTTMCAAQRPPPGNSPEIPGFGAQADGPT